jgi:isopenicillin-N N-acyltransferase-like protein
MKRVSLVFVCLLVAMAAGPSLGAGYRTSIGVAPDDIPVVVVSGTPYEMGYTYGTLMANEVRACMTGYLGYAQSVEPVRCSDTNLDAAWDATLPYVPTRFVEEMQGVADGSGISFDVLRRAHCITLVVGYACSGAAVWGAASADGHLYQIRNLDWSPGIKAGLHNYPVIVVYASQAGVAYANIGFAGWIGSTAGISTEGVALSEKGASPDSDYPYNLDGLPWYVMFRNILHTASTLQDALSTVGSAKRIKQYYYVIGEGDEPAGRWLKAFAPDLWVYADNDPSDPRYPNVLPNVVYATDNNAAAWTHITNNYGAYTPQLMIDLSKTLAGSSGSCIYVVYDATTREAWVAYAEGTDGAFQRPYVYFNLYDYVLPEAKPLLFQDNFDDPNWATNKDWKLGNTLYGQAYERLASGVVQLSAGSSTPAAGPEAAMLCANGLHYFVDNLAIQVDLNIQSGGGGGIFWGFEDAVGNEYYLTVSPSYGLLQISEEPFASGHSMVGNAPWPVQYGTWYTVKIVSTGTTFEVWFNERGQALEKIFDVPQDQNHPGFQSHMRGGCGLFAENDVLPGPSTVLFDNFLCDGLLVPPKTVFHDDFENAAGTLGKWTPLFGPTATFEATPYGQALRVAAGDNLVAMVANNSAMYYSDAFTLRFAACLDEAFWGGVGFAAAETTPYVYSDYFLYLRRTGDTIGVRLIEEENNVHSTLGTAVVASAPGEYWYNVEVFAGVTGITGAARYRVWVWPRGAVKPAAPVIDVPQDVLHPGYRLLSLGLVDLWQDTGVPPGSGLYDDFCLIATQVPAANTPPGTSVSVDAGEGVILNFDNVETGGSTQVETSTTGPGAGPGNFELKTGYELQGMYYDINTSCTFTGPVTIWLNYDDTGMELWQEEALGLWHYDTLRVPPEWVNVTRGRNTDLDLVWGQVDHLSVFAIGAPPKLDGFLQPINMPPQQMSVFKAGSTIPVKFRLRTFFTAQNVDNATVTLAVESLGDDAASVTVNEAFIQGLEDAGNVFRYDSAEQQYIFNLKTRGLAPGLYRIHAQAYDGLLDKWVDVRLKK